MLFHEQSISWLKNPTFFANPSCLSNLVGGSQHEYPKLIRNPACVPKKNGPKKFDRINDFKAKLLACFWSSRKE